MKLEIIWNKLFKYIIPEQWEKNLLILLNFVLVKLKRQEFVIFILTWLKDSSASVNSVTQNIDDRVLLIFELGDPELITDLREINEGRISKYDLFWEYALKYLEQESIWHPYYM